MNIIIFIICLLFKNVNNVNIIPLENDIYDNDHYVYLFANEESGTIKCCGKKHEYSDYIIILDNVYKDCNDNLRCETDNNFEHWIKKSNCEKGTIETNYGCISTYNADLNLNDYDNCNHTVDCHSMYIIDKKTSQKGIRILCKDFYYTSYNDEYSGYKPSITFKMNLDKDGNIYYNDKSGVHLKRINMKACVKKVNTKLINIKYENNLLTLNLNSNGLSHCKLLLKNNIESFTCKNNCYKLTYYQMDENKEKEKATIICGNEKEDFWFFRNNKNKYIPHILYSRSHWTTISKTWFIIFILYIIFGYPITRIFVGLLYIICNYSSFIYSYVIKFFSSHNVVNTDNFITICEYCQNDLQDYIDADLHSIYCHEGRCPYCKEEENPIEPGNHIKDCLFKREAIKAQRTQIDNEIKEAYKKMKKDLRENIWRNDLSVYKLPTKIWIVLSMLFFILMFISPSTALNMPCNRHLGESYNCHDEGIEKNNPQDHYKWSSIELSMIDKLEFKFKGNEYQRNSINRLKNEIKLFENRDSEEVLEFKVGTCNENKGKCNVMSIIDWIGDIKDSYIKMFKINSNDFHDESLHLIITGVEMLVEVTPLYYTTEWELDIKNVFSCTESDCSKICVENKNECIFKVFHRSSDTSWAHNPAWCLSVNQGCTCASVHVQRKKDKPFYSIVKTGRKMIKAVLCLEQSSKFIDCEIISKSGNYKIHHNDIYVSKWEPNFEVPEMIIYKLESGSSLHVKEIYTYDVCGKNKCKLGEFGDIQFSKPVFLCNDTSFYFSNFDELKGELRYSFATTPYWDVNHPESGVKINPIINLESNYKYIDHFFNVSSNQLIVTSGNLGEFEIKVSLNNIELYKYTNEFKLTKFKIIHCLGEYGTEIGGICTYEICITGKGGTIRFLPTDNFIIQDDRQDLNSGCQYIRKHLYIRGYSLNYKMCIETKDNTYCDNNKFNFTEPKYFKGVAYAHTFMHKSEYINKHCDTWLDISCLGSKLMDFAMLIKESIIFILISTITIIIILIIIHMIRYKNNKLTIDYKNQKVFKRLKDLKSRGFDIKDKNIEIINP